MVFASFLVLVTCYRRSFNKTYYFLPFFYMLTAVYSLIGFVFYFGRDIPFQFYSSVQDVSVYSAIVIYALSAMVLSLAGLVAPSNNRVTQKRVGDSSVMQVLIARAENIPVWLPVLLVTLWLIVFIYSYGALNIIQRDSYRPVFNFEGGIKIAKITLPLVAFVIGLIKVKFIRLPLFIITLLVVFATTSRSTVVVLFCYSIIISLMNPKRIKYITTAALLGAVFASAAVTDMRFNDVQGLWPNIKSLTSVSWGGAVVYAINYVLSFSVGVMAYATEFGHLRDIDEIIRYSLDPRPSVMSGASIDVANLYGAAPFPALAILFYGENLVRGLVLVFFIGVLFSYLAGRAKNNLMKNIVIAMCIIMFAISSVQYDLRTAMRFVYYPLLFFIFIDFLVFSTRLTK